MKSFRPTVALFVLLILGLCYTKSSQAQGENKPELTLEQRLEYSGVAVREEGWHIWGSSPVIGPDGDVHLFVARWPVSAKFDPGWRTHSQIAHYVSSGPEGPFRFSDVALAGTESETWDRYGIHNPAIHKVGNKYVLLYIGNTGLKEHPANQRIGMALSDSPYGPWKKVGRDGMILGSAGRFRLLQSQSGKRCSKSRLFRASGWAFLFVFQVK